MKIIFDIYNMSGGATKSQIEHMLAMKNSGHEVIATIDKDYDLLKVRLKDIKVIKTNNFDIRNPIMVIRNIIKWVQLLNRIKPDIIHTNRTVQNKFVKVVSKLTGTPHLPANPGGSAAIHNVIPLKGSVVMVYSYENKEQFVKCGHKEENVHLLSNRITIDDTLRRNYSMDKDTVSILFAGNYKITTFNGCVNFLEFIRENAKKIRSKIVIHFAGRDTTKNQIYLPKLLKLAEDLNGTNNPNIKILYRGWVDDISNLENECDICIGKGRSIIQPALKGKLCFVISDAGTVTRIRKDTVHDLYKYNFTCRGTDVDDSEDFLSSINEPSSFDNFIHESININPLIKSWYLTDCLSSRLIEIYSHVIQETSNKNVTFASLYSFFKIYYYAIRYGHTKA